MAENNMSPDSSASISIDRIEIKFLLLIASYFALHIVLRVFISDSLDYDEAEQALLGQWLLAGYTEQPPLYTWIQYLLFELFGKNTFSISLLKNFLLFLTYVFVFLSGKIILRDNLRAVLATSSLLLIPQIAWESQRDMTHTTLVVFAAAASLFLILKLIAKRHLLSYLLLGLFLGVGFMAKANFGLFVLVAVSVLLTLPEGRKLLFHRLFTVTLLVILLINTNYLLWMFHNQDIVFSATHKFKRAVANYYVAGPQSLVTNSFLFLTPLWFFVLLLFPKGYGLTDNFSPSVYEKFITRYVIFVFVILFIVVIAFKVTYVKDRWLQPLLFAAPLVFFSRVPIEKVPLTRFRNFLRIAAVAGCAVYIAFTIRVVGASYIDRFCRLNYPFSAITEALQDEGFENGLIISNNRFLAGNMHFQFPRSSAVIPGYNFEKIDQTKDHQATLVVWKTDRSQKIPAKLADFVQSTYQLDITTYPVKLFTQGYKFGRGETVTMAAIHIPQNPG